MISKTKTSIPGEKASAGSSSSMENVESVQSGGGLPRENEIRPPGERFVILEESENYVRKFRLQGRKISMRIKNPPSEKTNPITWLEDVMHDIHAHVISLSKNENDLIGVTISSDRFTHGPAGLSFRPVEHFSVDDLSSLLSNISQSNDEFEINETLHVYATFIEVPVGSGAPRKKHLTIDALSLRSMVAIQNDDNLCLPRALAVGLTFTNMKKDDSKSIRDEWRVIRDGRRQLQKERAEKLIRDAGVIIPPNGCGYNEIEQFQSYLARLGVIVVAYEKNSFGNQEPAFFEGRLYMRQVFGVIDYDGYDVINLCYDARSHHYDLILNLTGVAKSKFYCAACNKRYHHIDQHKCPEYCINCFVSPACKNEGGGLMKCEECNRNFFGRSCFENHKRTGAYKKNNRKLCDVLKICRSCCKVINKFRGEHECGKNWCSACKKKHSVNDLCYMQPIKVNREEESRKKYLYIFYDFEARQEDSYKNHPTTKVHVPNLCVVQQVCTDCINSVDVSEWCSTCGIREYIFREKPVERLIELCARETSQFAGIFALGHNMGGYDGHFLLAYLIEKSGQILPSIILNGQKIVCITYGRTKFLDSVLYFHMKLSKLVKAFGLDKDSSFARPDLKKGYFPHYFNTAENADYVGPLPDPRYYGADSMSTSERDTFFVWYNANVATSVFDMQRDIVEYCRLDVEILRRACLAFRKIFLDMKGSDPFVHSCTIASAVSRFFRERHLKPDTIAIIPPGGYRRGDKHSQKSVECLLLREREEAREIRHAGNAREFYLPEGFKVDGYSESREPDEKGVVYEFQGCYVHGCVKCFKSNRDQKMVYGGLTFTQAFENARAKIAWIESLGYEVKEIWECEFDRMMKENREFSDYIANHPLSSKVTLFPRLGFFGGRTETFKSYFLAALLQDVDNLDVCSLYPYACNRGNFPVGHPKILVGSQIDEYTNGDNNDLSRVNGLIKLKWLAPRNLYIPLLPMKLNGRLLFGLCRSCCEEMRQEDCNHRRVSEREVEGVYVIDEIRKAISLGYRVTKIYVIWHFKMTRYDQSTGEGGLFASLIDAFLKMKQEASGWPAWCIDDETRNRYIEEYEREEGIRLEPAKIEHNPGLRSVSKLALVAFWGKLGMKNNKKKTEIIKTREALLKLLTAPDKEVYNALSVNQDILYVNWAYREEAVSSAPNTNIVLANFITAIARLKLYEMLEKLEHRMIYCDTDSCLFLNNKNAPNEYRPKLSNFLGGWVDELASNYSPGTKIREFASPAVKFYAYRAVTPNGDEIENCKIKGITLNYESCKKINFKSIKDLVLRAFENDDEREENAAPNDIRVRFRAIRRMPFHNIVTRDESKTCSVVFKKRRYVTPTSSLPFGYKEKEGEVEDEE